MTKLLLRNIQTLVTMDPLAKSKGAWAVTKDSLGIVNNAWLAVDSGKILTFGSGSPPTAYSAWPSRTLDQKLVLPGLIDAHTHPIFGGSRAKEFCMRLDGATYQEIAAAGGGIKSSVASTRGASDDELTRLTLNTLQKFLKYGVTTVEAKSGYGLNVSEELRLLRVLKKIRSLTPQALSVTCLALHAVMPEFKNAKSWADAATRDLLPIVAAEQLADAVDAFVERGYFEPADVREYLKAAKRLGLAIRLHADEFVDSGGAGLAAEQKALSADHLQFAAPEAIKRMAAAGVVAVLLPGTSLYTKIPYTNAKRFIEAGCAVAIATDFNPGSCVVDNLPLMMTVGALHCGLTAAEALAAVTYAPAKALGLSSLKGALSPGFDADFIVHKMESEIEFVADLGRSLPSEVWIKGQQII